MPATNRQHLPPTVHTLSLLFTLCFSYLFVINSVLQRYALQAVALTTLAFFGLKLVNKQKVHHLIPQYASFELALVTFIFSLVIGATGNTNSIFYPLIYIYLFLLVFSTYTQSAVMTTLGLMLYQYLLMPATTTYIDLFDLVSLPVILVFFIFAKKQHEELIKEQQVLAQEDQALMRLEKQLELLKSQLAITQANLDESHQQLAQLQPALEEVDQLLTELMQQNPDYQLKPAMVKLKLVVQQKLKLIQPLD